MKKILVFMAVLLSGLLLTACNLWGSEVTTSTTTETVTADTENYLEINTGSDLLAIEMDKSYILMADINISTLEWTPIGDYNNPYMGNFDGNGHTISGLKITDQNLYFNGLFGYVTGNISNLNLTDVTIDYQTDFLSYAGGIAGYVFGGDVTNCTVSGSVEVTNTMSNTFAGMLLGYVQAAMEDTTTYEDFVSNDVSGNSVTGDVSVDSIAIAYVGGFIGKVFNTNVSGNYSEATVNVTARGAAVPVYVGGFIGHNYGGILQNFESSVDDINLYIQDNVSLSNVSVTNTESEIFVGGFIALSQEGFLSNNYSESAVSLAGTATEENVVRVGGFLAEDFDCVVEDSVVVISIDDDSYDKEYQLDAYVAGDFNSTDPANVYVISLDPQVLITTNQVVNTTYNKTDLTAAFYEDMLDWSSDFYTLIIGIPS